MTSSSLLDPFISKLLNDNCNSESLQQLRMSVEDQKRHLNPAQFHDFLGKLTESAALLVNPDQDIKHKTVGLSILDCFLDINDELDTGRKKWIADVSLRVFENDKLYLETNSDLFCLAAALIGHWARVATTSQRGNIQVFYTDIVMKWVCDSRSENRRYSGVITLKQLAINYPGVIYNNRRQFNNKMWSDQIWNVLTDKNILIREASAEAVEAVLNLFHQRGTTEDFLRNLILKVSETFQQNTTNDKVHGSILAFETILKVFPSNELLNIIRKEFPLFIWGILRRRDAKEFFIKSKVIELIPKLAVTSSSFFTQDNKYTTPSNFLTISIQYLLTLIRIPNEYRSLAYLSLGQLFLSLPHTLRDKEMVLRCVLSGIKNGFEDPFCIEALQCLAMVVKVSPYMRQYVDDNLIQLTFQGGLTPQLIDSLKVFVRHSPGVRSMVQTRLLNNITSILLNAVVTIDASKMNGSGLHPVLRSVKPSIKKNTTVISRVVGVIRGSSTTNTPELPIEEIIEKEELILALKVLASFDFTSSKRDLVASTQLLQVVREGAVRFVDDYDNTIRSNAAITCATVLDHIVDVITSPSDRAAISQVIDRLLVLGVGDNSEDIRLSVLQSLQPSLDRILAESSSIYCLIEALNDESIHVRSGAMTVLSRLAQFNSLQIMPLMHLTLSELIRQLQMSRTISIKKDSVILLRAMVRGIGKLIIPYAQQVMEPLLGLSDDVSPDIAGAAVATIGDLALVAPGHVADYIEILFPKILEAMSDVTSVSKQTIAVVTLGKMVSSMCVTDNSYVSHPRLFEIMVQIIQSSDPITTELRVQAMKTAGLLGAVGEDTEGAASVAAPQQNNFLSTKEKQVKPELPSHKTEDNDIITANDIYDQQNDEAMSIDMFYLAVVVKALMAMLRDSTLTSHHDHAANVAMMIIRSLGLSSLPQLDNMIDGITFRISKTSDTQLQENLLHHLITLIEIFGRNVYKHVVVLMRVISENMMFHLQPSLSMIEALYMALPQQEFSVVLREVLPHMTEILLDEADNMILSDASSSPLPSTDNFMKLKSTIQVKNTTENRKFSKANTVMKTFAILSSVMSDYRLNLVIVILIVLEHPRASVSVKKDALSLVIKLVRESENLNDFASRIIQPVLRLLASKETSLQNAALTAMSCLLCSLGPAYLPFIIPANRSLQHLQCRSQQQEEYERLLSRLLQQRPLPAQPSFSQDLFLGYDGSRPMSTHNSRSNVDFVPVPMNNVKDLNETWTLSETEKRAASDLTDWLKRLSVEHLKQSPSSILRPCAALAQAYEPLASQLFNVSFMAIWDASVSGKRMTDAVSDSVITTSIEHALNIAPEQSPIRTTLLNVVEFMEMRDKRLPLDIKILASQAEKASMFAISLRYREIEFSSPNISPSNECIEALINLNNLLGLRESASGVLQYVRIHFKNLSVKPFWLEKLYRWNDAKSTYSKQIEEWKAKYETLTIEVEPRSPLGNISAEISKKYEGFIESKLGMLRCHHALAEYEDLLSSTSELQGYMQRTVAVHDKFDLWMCEIQQLGAYAAWNLGKWSDMDAYVHGQQLSRNHDRYLYKDGTFYQAVLAIHKQEFNKAARLITSLRESMAGRIGTLLSDSFSRAHKAMVTMQVITELEEVLEYRQAMAKSRPYADLQSQSMVFSTSSNAGHSSYPSSRGTDTSETFRTGSDLVAKKEALMLKWKRRWSRAPKAIEIYRQILMVRSLAIDPAEDLDSWLDLISLCRKENSLSLCRNLLKRLYAPLDLIAGAARSNSFDSHQSHDTKSEVNYDLEDQAAFTSPRVLFAMHKYLWDSGERQKALSHLDTLVVTFFKDNIDEELKKLKVQCHLKRAEWMRMLNENCLTDTLLNRILEILQEARDISNDQYSVWHAWAVNNYYQLRLADAKETAEENAEAGTTPVTPTYFTDDLTIARYQFKGHKGHRRGSSLGGFHEEPNMPHKVDRVTPFVIEAIKGFIHSIGLGRDQPVFNILQDILRLLTLLFTYGSRYQVYNYLEKELDSVSAEDWLSVIPQLIARMHMKSRNISHLLRKILTKVATAHPQALIYPISVAVNNADDEQQRQVAGNILSVMRDIDSRLVSDAAIVSRELLRVAISPHEMWSEGLERAADLYLSRNIDGMLDALHNLQASMNDLFNVDDPSLSPKSKKQVETLGVIDKETLKDISFRQEYSRDLHTAYTWILRFEQSKNFVDLHQAWDIYHDLFKRISNQIKKIKVVELCHVSPQLTDSKSLMLAVPGTYKPSREIVRIASFAKSVDVISSKQRPRKLMILGSDGNDYRFLLKGHEDLRQDERVMQLFGLINACLENNPKTRKKGYKIVRYTVLPLSNNAGVLGWVENCDTLNQLVKRYREQRDFYLDAEVRLQKSKAPDYDKLPLIHKIEVFQEVQNDTQGKDLALMLWLNSKSSESWVQRRANFTKSLAVMSMVGYILGLGDRHPSNLMLDRVSGRVVHIDFGDCFEVAKNREAYPETIPFRLTRMLILCMGASGIEGTFRGSSETVMRILRQNRESVMAMLEAFVYDPLISWRLLAAPKEALPLQLAADDSSRITDQVMASLADLNSDSTKETLIGQAPEADLIMGQSHMTRQVSHREPAKAEDDTAQENLNSRALEIINRIQSKLTGRDFNGGEYLTVEQQVEKLIMEATSSENLCQLFAGWCPYW